MLKSLLLTTYHNTEVMEMLAASEVVGVGVPVRWEQFT